MVQKTLVYIGTYTDLIKFGNGQLYQGKGMGIYLLELNSLTGELKLEKIFTDIVNPSYLVFNKKNSCLYAVNELKEFEGKPSGSVSSFKVSETSGKLTFINKRSTQGTDPCHVEVNPDGTNLYVSNFMSGSVCVYPIQQDSSIGEPSQFIQHFGSSEDPNRQTGPHAHSLVFSPDGRFACVPDLGIDKLMIYKTTSAAHPLTEAAVPYFKTQPGAGPRQCAFSPSGDFCYLINELDSTILALSYDKKNGSFDGLQCVSSLPGGIKFPGNTCADVHVTPDGKYLYGSNRGHNSLIVYKINQNSGKLEYVDCQSCGGEIPRNFAIDPSGNYILCANQDSDNIVVFEIDHETGLLTKRSEIAIPTPVCVKPYVF